MVEYTSIKVPNQVIELINEGKKKYLETNPTAPRVYSYEILKVALEQYLKE